VIEDALGLSVAMDISSTLQGSSFVAPMCANVKAKVGHKIRMGGRAGRSWPQLTGY
jgi:hypothetical protein